MTPQYFAYWLQGFVELHGAPPTPAQWEVIKEHLALVFNKVTTKSATTSGGLGDVISAPPFGSIGDSTSPSYCAPLGQPVPMDGRLCSEDAKAMLPFKANWPAVPVIRNIDVTC